MKQVLLICNHFAPDNMIAAVRTTKIAKYLQQRGYNVEVVAEKKRDMLEDEILKKEAEGINMSYAENSKGMMKFIAWYNKAITPFKKEKYDNLNNRIKINPKTGKSEFYPFQTAYPILGSLDYLVELMRQYDLFLSVRNRLKKYKKVDYIFTSYGDYFSIFAGIYIHNKQKDVPWIFDIRDAICGYKFTPSYVRWIARSFENYIWKRADCITAVSKGICRRIPRRYWKKVHCITNGFDRTDREGLCEKKEITDKMIFTYTGAMYGGIRNLSVIFECIQKLINDGKMEEDKIEFHFAGKESAYEIFRSQAQAYALDDKCIYFGKVTRKRSLELQMQSDILLVSSFDYQTDTGGIITGKALEYMSADRPMIALINGDIVHSELADIIRNANLGVAYEESHHDVDFVKLYSFLAEKYEEFVATGTLSHNPDEKAVNRYDYRYLSKKLIRIMDTL